MFSIVACPRCAGQVSILTGALPESHVRCPLCHSEYSLGEVLSALPPALVVVSEPGSSHAMDDFSGVPAHPLAEPAAHEESWHDAPAEPNEHAHAHADLFSTEPLTLPDPVEHEPHAELAPEHEHLSFDDEPLHLHSGLEPQAEHHHAEAADLAPGHFGDAEEMPLDFDAPQAHGEHAAPAEDLLEHEHSELASPPLDEGDDNAAFHFDDLPSHESDLPHSELHGSALPEPEDEFAAADNAFDENAFGETSALDEENEFAAEEDFAVSTDFSSSAELPADEFAAEGEEEFAAMDDQSALPEHESLLQEGNFFREAGEDTGEEIGVESGEPAMAEAPLPVEKAAKGKKDKAAKKDKKPAKAKKERSLVGTLLAMSAVVIGGLLCVFLCYIGLLWGAGPGGDFLSLGPKLPALLVPAAFHQTAPPPFGQPPVALAQANPPADPGMPAGQPGDKSPEEDAELTAPPKAKPKAPADAADDMAAEEPDANDPQVAKGGDEKADDLPADEKMDDEKAEKPEEAAADDSAIDEMIGNTKPAAKPKKPAAADPDEATPGDDLLPGDKPAADMPEEEKPEDKTSGDDLLPGDEPAPKKPAAKTPEPDMPAEDTGLDEAPTTKKPAAPADDLPADDMPEETKEPAEAAEPAIVPVDAPSYKLSDVDQAMTEAKESDAAMAKSASLSPDDLKKTRAQYYRRLYRLGEVITFAADDDLAPRLGDERTAVTSMLQKTGADDERLAAIGKAAVKWLAYPKRGPHAGILVGGTVAGIAHAGKLYEIKITIPGEAEPLSVFTGTKPDLADGDKAMLLGSIIEDPASNLPGYTGNQPTAIWGGLTTKL